MKKQLLSIGIGLLTLCACQETTTTTGGENHITVDITQPEKRLKVSDLFSNIKYVKLETTSESLIKGIKDILAFDGKMLVVDTENTSLLLFDGDGKFLRSIGGKGVGPGEYTGLEDAVVDREGKRILVLDTGAKRILIYDFDGNFVEQKTVDFMAEEMAYAGDDKVVFYCDYKSNRNYAREDARPNVILYDLKTEKGTPYQFVSNKVSMQELTAPFTALSTDGNGSVYCLHTLTNDILVMDKDGLARTLTLDFGADDMERRQQYAQRLEDEELTVDDIMPGGKAAPQHLTCFSILSTADYLFVTAWDRRESMVMYQIAYSQESGKCIFGKRMRGMPLEYDLPGSLPFQYYSADGNTLYGSVMPEQILAKEDTEDEVLKQLQENLQEDDNPVVLIATTKPL